MDTVLLFLSKDILKNMEMRKNKKFEDAPFGAKRRMEVLLG